MKTLQYNSPRPIRDRLGDMKIPLSDGRYIAMAVVHRFYLWAKNVLPLRGVILIYLLVLFLFTGTILQAIDPAAGVLDIGILSVLLLGLIGGIAAILCSLWLQELLWQPFKVFRKQFRSHYNQLSSWQQCILYFSVFFLLLYAVLWGLAIVL